MKKSLPLTFLGTFAICLGLASVAMAQTSKTTQSFIQSAAIGNQFEISAGRLALQNSQNDEVKQFAQQMVDDHTQIGDQMKAAIASSNLNLPQPSPSLDEKHQKILDMLNDASLKDFDKKYIKTQIDAHNDAVSLFGDYAKHGDNDGLKNFAAQTLPVIKEHQTHVKQLKAAF